jgi:hypothetical protein
MRIPPAIAKEIGSYYAAAHANDAAAETLTESAKLLASASGFVAAGDFEAALTDANDAVSLLSKVTDTAEAGISSKAVDLASSASSAASTAIDLLGMRRPQHAVQGLQRASLSASHASAAAVDAAADYRYAADELAKQYA